MLVLGLGLGLKAKFCGLGLAINWPWPWDFGLGLRGLALAKNSRPKSWQTTKFTINFHRLEWIIFQDPHSLLTYSGQSWPCKITWKNSISLLFIVILCTMGWPWPWDYGLCLGLGCSGLVNITASAFYPASFIPSNTWQSTPPCCNTLPTHLWSRHHTVFNIFLSPWTICKMSRSNKSKKFTVGTGWS